MTGKTFYLFLALLFVIQVITIYTYFSPKISFFYDIQPTTNDENEEDDENEVLYDIGKSKVISDYPNLWRWSNKRFKYDQYLMTDRNIKTEWEAVKSILFEM